MSKKLIGRNKSLGKMLVIFMVLALVGFAPLQYAHGASMTLVISPSTAFVGDFVEASGLTISGNGEVRVYLEELLVATTISDEAGSYSIEFPVPAVPCSTYFMMAVDVVSDTVAYASLSVEPRISVTPADGSFENEITAIGYGFAAFSYMTLWLDDVQVYPYPSPYTDPLGSFEASFRVPAMPNGTYAFQAVDESGNTGEAFFTVTPKIVTQPVSAPSGTLVFIGGYGFAVDADLTIMFGAIDVTPYSHATAWSDGSFSVPFFVPEVQDGIYSISVSDTVGNVATAPFVVPSPIMTLSPDTVSGSSLVTVEGLGFRPDSPVMLYFEDTLISGSVDSVLPPESISASFFAPAPGRGGTIPDEYGSFQYSFVVPTGAPGRYDVTACQASYSFPSEFEEVASATLTIVDETCLDIEATAGSVHFRGELSEFIVKTSLRGELVNVHFNKATLYWSNGTLSQDLLSSVKRVSTGFYRIPYAIEEDAPLGTYSLLVQVRYQVDLVDASGAASASFLISPTLTSQAAQIVSIENDIATIVIPDLSAIRANLTAIDARLAALDGQVATIQSDLGTLKADVEAISATLVTIQGNVATIQSDLGTLETDVSAINASLVSIMGTEATIQTSLGTLTTDTEAIHAKVTSIDDGVATIESDVGTVKVRVGDSGSQMNATSIFALVAALSSLSAAAVIIFTRKTPKAPSTSTTTQPSERPTDEFARNAIPKTEETQSATPTEAMQPTETPVEKPQETPTQTQTEKPSEKPQEEAPQPETPPPTPSSSNPPDQSTPPESSQQPEPQPQDQPQQQPEPEMIVVHLEDQPPQQN